MSYKTYIINIWLAFNLSWKSYLFANNYKFYSQSVMYWILTYLSIKSENMNYNSIQREKRNLIRNKFIKLDLNNENVISKNSVFPFLFVNPINIFDYYQIMFIILLLFHSFLFCVKIRRVKYTFIVFISLNFAFNNRPNKCIYNTTLNFFFKLLEMVYFYLVTIIIYLWKVFLLLYNDESYKISIAAFIMLYIITLETEFLWFLALIILTKNISIDWNVCLEDALYYLKKQNKYLKWTAKLLIIFYYYFIWTFFF